MTLHVAPGEPMKITAVDIQADKEAAAIDPIRRVRRAIEWMQGQTQNHGSYDAARDALSAQLTANSFLDARLLTRRVEVSRSNHSATIKLTPD